MECQWRRQLGFGLPLDPFAPYAPGDIANFSAALTSGTAVITLDGQRTVGTINFNDTAGSYDLQAGSGGSLRLDGGSQTALINSQAGMHSISAPITLTANANLAVAGGSTLTLSGGICGTSSALALTGPGILILTGNNTYGATSIASARPCRSAMAPPAAPWVPRPSPTAASST